MSKPPPDAEPPANPFVSPFAEFTEPPETIPTVTEAYLARMELEKHSRRRHWLVRGAVLLASIPLVPLIVGLSTGTPFSSYPGLLARAAVGAVLGGGVGCVFLVLSVVRAGTSYRGEQSRRMMADAWVKVLPVMLTVFICLGIIIGATVGAHSAIPR